MPSVYLDWAATAPLCEAAAAALAPYVVPGAQNMPAGGNANSLHTIGRSAFRALEDARTSLARSLGARPDEMVFTSGATEANNAALFGIVAAVAERRRAQGQAGFVPHIITTAIEHDAVLEAARMLKRFGCELDVLTPNAQGVVSVEQLKEALRSNTVLVSVQMVNNEVGTVQPIAELAACAHAHGVLFHTDAVQALGKVPINLRALGVDAASFSAHKVGGLKGVGALYLRTKTPFLPMAVGGGQESSRRSGTQNVAGAVCFAAAADAAVRNVETEAARLRALRDELYARLTEYSFVHPSVCVEAASTSFAPHIVNVCADGFESETLILRLDDRGIAVSGGSACASHSLEPSHVLRALGIPRDRALCSLRISMGEGTSQADIHTFLQAFDDVVKGS